MTQHDLANDTIRIALRIAGQNPDSMNQFERASALLNIVQEFASLQSVRDAQRIESMWERIVGKPTFQRVYNRIGGSV